MRAFESESIYFDFDKSDLKPEAQATLKKKADWLRRNPGYSLRIEGNCDDRGTNEYNLALGERRAASAKKFLTALGIAEDRIVHHQLWGGATGRSGAKRSSVGKEQKRRVQADQVA